MTMTEQERQHLRQFVPPFRYFIREQDRQRWFYVR